MDRGPWSGEEKDVALGVASGWPVILVSTRQISSQPALSPAPPGVPVAIKYPNWKPLNPEVLGVSIQGGANKKYRHPGNFEFQINKK